MASHFELLDRWAAGDRAAGGELLRRHFGAVYRFFHNKCSGGTEDLTGPQLAEVLGISEPGVRSRIARAKEALRKRVAELA